MNQDALSNYEALFQETGNPLYAWEALAVCRPDLPLPKWLFEYLQGCARDRLESIGASLNRPPVHPEYYGLLDLAEEFSSIKDEQRRIVKRNDERRKFRGNPDESKRINEACERRDSEFADKTKNAATLAANLVGRALGIRRGDDPYNAFEYYAQVRENADKASFLDSPLGKKRWAWQQIAKANDYKTGNSRTQIYAQCKRARELWKVQQRARSTKAE